MELRLSLSRTLLLLAALVLIPVVPAEAARLIIGLQTGGVREWTELEHGTLHLLGRGTLRRLYDTIVEPRFFNYLTRMLEHIDEDVTITLVDDRERRQVWPLAQGTSIRLGIKHFLLEYDGIQEKTIRGLLAHEMAHTQDRTTLGPRSYGLDGHHYPEEILDQRGAMAEGWGNYHQLQFDKATSRYRDPTLGESFEKEDTEVAGHYDPRPARNFNHWMRNEEAVARILHHLATELPDGKQMIDEAFDATNNGAVRTLPQMLRAMCELNPRQQRRIAMIVDASIDECTTDQELREIFLEGGKAYAKLRRQRKVD